MQAPPQAQEAPAHTYRTQSFAPTNLNPPSNKDNTESSVKYSDEQQPGSRKAGDHKQKAMISMMDSNIHDQPLSGRHQNERHLRETSKFGNFKQSPSDGQSSGPNFEELLGSKENEIHD